MPRVFFAVPMPFALRCTFIACREACATMDPSWAGEKWVAPENLHITLRFLGSVPESDIDRCVQGAAHELASIESFRLRLDLVRAIPQRRSASLLWVAPSLGVEETVDLAEALARATSFVDFQPDGKRFRPHVTLCRARAPRRLAAGAFDEMERLLHVSGDRAVSMSVPEVTLFASTLTPRGPVYEERATIPLGG
ncbi:MAG: RNA 2',3'-cyclic phosphodiesterase [Coriobacteriia bacterium]